MEATRAGMPAICVSHDNSGGPVVKDIHLENFNISIGGRDLIVDGSLTLSFGRHYGVLDFHYIKNLSILSSNERSRIPLHSIYFFFPQHIIMLYERKKINIRNYSVHDKNLVVNFEYVKH